MSALVENPLTETLRKEFEDEDYRYAYDEEFANSRMATQIKVIREKQELKQVELAELADMKQSRISALEDVNYNSWSVSTLRRLARALGVRFAFGFESWGELLPEIETFGRKSLEKPKFKEDPEFHGIPVTTSTGTLRAMNLPVNQHTLTDKLALAIQEAAMRVVASLSADQVSADEGNVLDDFLRDEAPENARASDGEIIDITSKLIA